MTEEPLGKFVRVSVRDIWQSEDKSFTPWLARNLKILADTLGFELELVAQEKAVGQFRADLLCKEKTSRAWVLVENQLARTDHGHLGQLLTYASGLDAVTIVWIASQFTGEHQAAMNWLNRITDDRFRFFGLEVEVWRIEESVPAPKFNIVAAPNDWSRSVARAARLIGEPSLTETQLLWREYWEAFLPMLDKAEGPVSGNLKPQPDSLMSFSIGRTGFSLFASGNTREGFLRAGFYISGPDAKKLLALLLDEREAIEQEFGEELDWREMRIEAQVVAYLRDVDPKSESEWPRQHEWLVSRINRLHRVFAPRIRTLAVGI